MSPDAWDVPRLGLTGKVHQFATDLKKAHPNVEFTDGLRTRAEQASRMAKNIALAGVKWVDSTYLPSTAKTRVVEWLKANPQFTRSESIAIGLADVFDRLTNDEMSKLSKHFIGRAVDIKPMEGLSDVLLVQAIESLCRKYGLRFLKREGGLKIYHVQEK